MTGVIERFLKYVSYDTQSDEESKECPSTKKQLDLAKELAKELQEMGAEQARVSQYGYVYAIIPANLPDEKAGSVPSMGLIAHMDTAPFLTGANVKPRLVKNYDGKDICLNEELGIYTKVKDFPFLPSYAGQDLIVTDGTTLLGGDDKAGVAEIMAMAEYFLTHPEVHHGIICIGFTPDEEIGRGADKFDVAGFGADFAYTVDGGELGEIEYENFNAASAKVTIRGFGIHPGASKNKMKNSQLIGMEFQQLLPVFQNPMYTEGYEGFFHLESINGDVEQTVMKYLVRDHDMEKFEQKKELLAQAAAFLNAKYGEGTVTLEVKDSYYNMKEKIAPCMHLVTDVCTAMEKLGIKPITKPVRGGTDGARLSYMGLPCPNICTGSSNFHGRYEFVSVQAMEKIVELLIEVVKMQV